MHRFGEVALGIDPVDSAVRDQGIDQGAARSGLGTPEKQVVLQTELRRANQILGEIVVDFEATFGKRRKIDRKRPTQTIYRFV